VRACGSEPPTTTTIERALIMSTVSIATAEVFEAGLASLRDKVDALNKRAKRHGMNMMTVQVVAEKAFFPVFKGLIGPSRPLYCVDITGDAPRIDGWALAARIEFNDIIGNVVRIAPDRCDDGSYVSYRTIGPVCEHCNSYRNRKDVFVLENSDGSRKIVGRNCLADFLRCKSADDFARYAEYADLAVEWAREASDGCDEYFGGGSFVPTMRLEAYLPVVAMLMRRIGWVSRTAAKERDDCSSTADLASYYLFGNDSRKANWIEKNELHACEDDVVRANCAIEWARNVDASGSEYLYTIKRIAQEGFVEFKGLDGYAASIIIAFDKACERQRDRDEKAKSAKRRVWFGSVGKREKKVNAKCIGLHSFNGYYGVTTIVRFEVCISEEEKAVLVWFASGDKYGDFDVDAEYVIDATIKAHEDDDKYGKDTKITRVKACAV
jgi:hypothetical protein